MDLQKKIEQIRQKPDHVRMRYVWGGVVVGMIIVVGVWLVSLSENFRAVRVQEEQGAFSDLKGQFDALAPLQNAAPSVEELLSQSLQNIPQQKEMTDPQNDEGAFPGSDQITTSRDEQAGASGLPIAQ